MSTPLEGWTLGATNTATCEVRAGPLGIGAVVVVRVSKPGVPGRVNLIFEHEEAERLGRELLECAAFIKSTTEEPG